MKQSKVLFKRGTKPNLPDHAPLGEPLYCVDTKELYVGQGEGVTPIPIGVDTRELQYLRGRVDELSERVSYLENVIKSIQSGGVLNGTK